jgi:hypothetical protein
MSRYVEVEAELLREGDKAALFLIDGEEHWIPWSQIEDGTAPTKVGESATMCITKWIAEQKEIDGDELDAE